MHILSTSRLKEFYEKYPEAKPNLLGWIKHTELAQWQNLVEVRQTFKNSADQVGIFTVFNIKGNQYRLITHIKYQTKKIYIRKFITHSEYDSNKWKNDPWLK